MQGTPWMVGALAPPFPVPRLPRSGDPLPLWHPGWLTRSLNHPTAALHTVVKDQAAAATVSSSSVAAGALAAKLPILIFLEAIW